ncbi:hypothetical protein B0H10DRAFT_2081074 [Mycena sp. CBHHK59/15]|nr:hypothetical protein B0H10DRAFT_2081074 [Mycena sp. CBHHK59/15]
MGAKYLCCLPLRLGVLVISLLQFLVSAFASAILIYALVLDAQDKNETTKIPSRTRTIAIILAAVYGLVAVISFTGFVGAIRKKESYVGAFSNLLRFFLGLQIAVVTSYFVFYFIDKNRFRKLCIGDSTDQKIIDACDSPSKLSLWILIVSAIVPILFQAYGVYIVASYVQQLHRQTFLREETFGIKGPDYVPVGEEAHPLTHQAGYPYADNAHSYGPGQYGHGGAV